MDTDELNEELVTDEQIETVEAWIARLSRSNGTVFADLEMGGMVYEGRYCCLGEVELVLPGFPTSPSEPVKCFVRLGDAEHFHFLHPGLTAKLFPIKPREFIFGPLSLSRIQHLLLKHKLGGH